jgi:hypothetical protein
VQREKVIPKADLTLSAEVSAGSLLLRAIFT